MAGIFVSYNQLGDLPYFEQIPETKNVTPLSTLMELRRKQQESKSKTIEEPTVEEPVIEEETVLTPDNTKSISRKDMVNYLTSKGYKKHHAQGIVGNLWQESAGNVGIIGKDKHDKRGSFGLAQWANDRRTKLHNKYGDNPTWKQQLDFLDEELHTTENKALQRLLATNDVNSATKEFMLAYERPSSDPTKNRLDNRIKYANNIV